MLGWTEGSKGHWLLQFVSRRKGRNCGSGERRPWKGEKGVRPLLAWSGGVWRKAGGGGGGAEGGLE